MDMTGVPSWAVWAELAARVGWTAIAAAVAVVMRRRGHDGGLWLLAGLVLGPFAVPAAAISARRAARRPATVVATGRAGPGALDVLVVVDEHDPAAALGWLAPDADLGELVLVAVVGRDTFDRDARAGALRRARAALTSALDRAAAAGVRATALIVEGRPADAVSSAARQHGIALIVVGPTGPGEALETQLRRQQGGARVVTADHVPAGELA